MNNFKRQLELNQLINKKSFFLLGPRATGKTYLIRQQLANEAIVLNLLHSELYLRLSAAPWDLEAIINAELAKKAASVVVIDEIQKVPSLLDEVHRLIEERSLRFLLTGSSARKLKRGSANLLAGRAWTAHLFPLSFSEVPHFDLDRFLLTGGLPMVYQSEFPAEELHAYISTYLYEEIQAEALVRKIAQFSRFLKTAALANGQQLNFAHIASDTQIPASTIKEHYQILEDTLLGFILNPWHGSTKRKAIATAKFYFFDTGVAHALAGTKSLERNSDLYGRSFEHWVAMELKAYLSYRRKTDELCFWRTRTQQEVDFVIGDHTAIEVKAASRVSERDTRGLKAIAEEGSFKNLLLVSQDSTETIKDGIRSLHWQTFMSELWADKLM